MIKETKRYELEIEKIRNENVLRQRELEFEQKKLEAEQFARDHELQIERLRLEKEGRVVSDVGERGLNLSGGFDLASNLRLLPKFNEHDPDVFFSLFETMSEERNWPVSIRVVMLQTVITGKAQEAYAALTMEDRKDYNKVKGAILKAYELVPEAYRQRFRGWRKGDHQTHSELGYWQVPLTPRAREVTSFITPSGLYSYSVMSFGLRNAPATFQRLMNHVVFGLEGCAVYLDDVIVFSETWEQHLIRLRALLTRLVEACLTVNLAKCEFAKATVRYLGKEVGQGKVRPVLAKVLAIQQFPPPSTKKELMRFLGMVGGCQPSWCWGSFVTDGADGLDYPISFFSRKFNVYQKNYSVIEKEALSLIWALQFFDVYVGGGMPIEPYTLTVKHLKGSDNVVADALSRVPDLIN
ncbi:hypothetical protein QQF64_025977 [Cirrhinus molitorella]|uniref:ribonuclease H n=1 Tax=Cirrhinus molitorella TaxID=172907 RepID=A0ABR3NQV2_9TELE